MKLWAALIVVVVALACFYGGYRAGYGAASAVGPAPTITAPQNATIPQAVVSRHEVKYPITIVDSAGKNVTIEKEPQRVVVISSTHSMVLATLGVGRKIIGADVYTFKDPILMSVLQKQDARDIMNVGSFTSPSLEAILGANPDLVVLYASFYKSTMDEVASKLPPNIKVVRFDLYKPSTMFDEVYKLGLIFNSVDRALELIEKWSSRFAYIVSKASEIKPSERVRVYFEGYTELTAAGLGSGWHQVLTLAGGINVFGDLAQPYPRISLEAVAERSPDVIIKVVSSTVYNPCSSNSTKPLKDLYNAIVSRAGWSNIPAVKNGRVYLYSTVYLSGLGYVAQVALVAKLLYPSVFKDVDPQQWIYDWLRDMGLENPEQVCKLPWVYPGFSAG
jgi:iron complex transport system substrate-binding protein